MDLSYIINILGEDEFGELNPVSPPIYQTSNFYFKSVDQFRKAISNEKENWIYSRGNNPTINLLCKKLAALEGAEDALVFASGMAAISGTILANIKTGDHIVSVRNPYSWTDTLMNRKILPGFGIEVSMIDGTNIQNIMAACRPNTKVIYLESPNSWTFEMQDLEAVGKFAREKGIITIIDNSYSTPLFQKPLSYGIDLVVHTASKYLGGHSDTVAGVCCGSSELIDKIFQNEFLTLGGIMSPMNAWLVLRGLRTLPLRMERVSRSTGQIVTFLSSHPKVKRIYYPYHPSHPQFELAKKQMSQGSGLFTVQVESEDIAAIEQFCNSLKYWRMAVSWGGFESLIIPSCTFVRPGLYTTLPANLIRFSVGLEDPKSLIGDLEKSFELL
ncbi:MAG: PLP-dependent transferase [Bacteroidetes bacterium]|nr:PLP-dependent transferase [Bacteroidota bacterium]